MPKMSIMKKNNLLLGIIACALFTLFSLAIRFESIVSREVFDYEWHSSTVVRHMMTWYEEGALTHHFAPPVTFPGTANRHINNHSSIEDGRLGYQSDEGVYYYVSYPPFGYMAPYLTFLAFGVEPSVLALRIFNVVTQILCAGLLFVLMYGITRNTLASVGAYCLYLFTGISLFMHFANYMSDMFVQVFFIALGLLFYEIISRKRAIRADWMYYTAFTAVFCAMVYTEWLGICVAGFLFLYGIYARKEVYGIPFIVLSVTVPSVMLMLMFVQYASVADLGTFLSVMADRYALGYHKSTLGEPVSTPMRFVQILAHYGKWYWMHITVVLISGLVLFFRKEIHSFLRSLSVPNTLAILLFFGVPVLLHHVLFFNWTAYKIHFYSVLKTAPFFALVIPLAFMHIAHTYKGKLSTAVLILCMGIIFGGSLGTYAYHMRTQAGADNIEYCTLGTEFKKRSHPDEVIFIAPATQDGDFNEIMSSVIVLCAERNFTMYRGPESAFELMRKNDTTKGIIFYIEHSHKGVAFVGQERISLPK